MAVILKNSDGWNVLLPILIHREAPPNLVPINGRKTNTRAAKFITKRKGAIFFKNGKGIFKKIRAIARPIATEIN